MTSKPKGPKFETCKADGMYSKNLPWNFCKRHCNAYYTAKLIKLMYKYAYNVVHLPRQFSIKPMLVPMGS